MNKWSGFLIYSICQHCWSVLSKNRLRYGGIMDISLIYSSFTITRISTTMRSDNERVSSLSTWQWSMKLKCDEMKSKKRKQMKKQSLIANFYIHHSPKFWCIVICEHRKKLQPNWKFFCHLLLFIFWKPVSASAVTLELSYQEQVFNFLEKAWYLTEPVIISEIEICQKDAPRSRLIH